MGRAEPAGRQYAAALAAAGTTLAAVSLFFLLPYFQRDLRYPLGWDAPFYVWRANLVPLDGLDRNGLVRAASPILLAVLARLTRQTTWTLAALVPPILAGIASLGGAAMVRAAFGLPLRWVPVIGILMWIAFGYAGMVWEQLDNVLNAALVLAAFAASLAAVAWGRGAVAAGLLWVGAGFAHWQFYLFAIAVFVGAMVVFARDELRAAFSEGPRSLHHAGPLLVAAGASGVVVGLGFLLAPFNPSVGPRFIGLRDLLRERFLRRAVEPDRYVALPLALAGGILVHQSTETESPPKARDLFLWLMVVWAGLTLTGAVAQAFGVPTAGLRLLHYFFPLTILAGVFVWRASEEAIRRFSPNVARVVSAAIVLITIGAIGAFALVRQSRVRVWVEPEAVRQAAVAGAYAKQNVPPGGRVLYVVDPPRRDALTITRWRNTILSSIPPAEINRSDVVVADLEGFIGTDDGAGVRASAINFVISAYAPLSFQSVASQAGKRQLIAEGVLLLRGPRPAGPVVARPPSANMAARTALPTASVIILILFVVGGGWASALLPPDRPTRALLSPALGITTVVLSTIIWERLGLSLNGWLVAAPAAIGAAAGWAVAVVRR